MIDRRSFLTGFAAVAVVFELADKALDPRPVRDVKFRDLRELDNALLMCPTIALLHKNVPQITFPLPGFAWQLEQNEEGGRWDLFLDLAEPGELVAAYDPRGCLGMPDLDARITVDELALLTREGARMVSLPTDLDLRPITMRAGDTVTIRMPQRPKPTVTINV